MLSQQPPYDDQRPRLAAVPDEVGDSAARPQHQNPPAEQAVLGALLLMPELAPQLRPELDGTDFYQPRHETIWNAIHDLAAAGTQPDPVTVGSYLHTHGQLAKIGGAVYLHDLMAACPIPTQAPIYARDVRDAARLRAVTNAATRLRQIADTADPSRVERALERAVQELDTAALRFGPAGGQAAVHVPNVREFLTDRTETYDWIVPGLLERGDRIILTGGEGSGKSTLARQIAVTCAAGIHPFSLTTMPPIRVLVIDFENSERQMARAFGRLYAKVSRDMEPDNLLIFSRLAGVDLMLAEDRAWMTSIVAACKPQLLITGPHYKMTAGDTDKEKESKPVALYLDQLRSDYGCAVWLEAHVGNETTGSRNRPERPFGWSGWRRWPEFGLYLAPDGQLKHWRGDRDQRDWPAVLSRGTDWPWSVSIDEVETRWNAIKKARQDSGGYLSFRDLQAATGLDRNAVQRTIGKGARHVHDWTVLNGHNPYTATPTEEETW